MRPRDAAWLGAGVLAVLALVLVVLVCTFVVLFTKGGR